MGSIFGTLFRVSTFGESHGKGLGVVIDGCPAGVSIEVEEIQEQLDRRKPGQSKITTSRGEDDRVEILSGIYEGKTLGTSIALVIYNKDARSSSYNNLRELYRPGHADYTYDARYGFRDWRGGGRASNRETAARVAAGVVAAKMLDELCGIQTLAWVEQVQSVSAEIDLSRIRSEDIEKNIVRCPDDKAAAEIEHLILSAKAQGNSLGGRLRFRVDNCPAGLGDPVFDKLTADIAKACMSIPATRSISFGVGEKAVRMTGKEHNDIFVLDEDGEIHTKTNRSGGILGGISNGQQIYGDIVFKPVATIGIDQDTVTQDKIETVFKAGGRHDPCVLPRAVPNVEAMISLVLADHLLRYSVASMERLKKIFQ